MNADLVQTINCAVMGRKGKPERDEIRFCCPAHDDEHPSARWNADKTTWVCDVCKEGGGALDLAKRLGIPLPAIKPNGNGHKVEPRVVASFDYGAYIIDRIEPGPDGRKKEFKPRILDGCGGWIKKAPPAEQRTLYRLAEALALPGPLVIPEGEAKADALLEMGIAAVGYGFGALAWEDHYLGLIPADREVVLLPDRDAPGQKARAKIARSFAAAGRAVRVAVLPGEGNDIIDFISAGGTADDIRSAITAADLPQADSEPAAKYGEAVRLDTIAPPKLARRVSTGTPELDALLGGGPAHRGLTLVVADTGGGKSRKTLAWCVAAVRAGYKALFMSTELTGEDIRLILETAGHADLLSGFFVLYGQNLSEFALALSAAVEDSPDGKVVGVVDYAQMIDLPRQDGRTDLGLEGMANDLARLANTLDVPTILTSQVSRGAIKRGPLDVHAGASGNMERAASAVIVITSASESEIEVTCHKLRWGKKGGRIMLTADWVALKFAAAPPAGISGIAGTQKHGKTSKRVEIVETVIRLHGKKDENGKLKGGLSYEEIAGLVDLSADCVQRHVAALAAVGRLVVQEGGGRGRPTLVFPPKADLTRTESEKLRKPRKPRQTPETTDINRGGEVPPQELPPHRGIGSGGVSDVSSGGGA